MANALIAHLAHGQQAFHAFFNFDESAERFHLRYPAGDFGSGSVFSSPRLPTDQRRVPASNSGSASGFLVDAGDFYIQHIANFDEFASAMTTAFEGHFRNVKQAIDSAEIDESAKVHHVANRASADLSFRQFGHQLFLLLFSLLFQNVSARENQIFRTRVELRDFRGEFWPMNCVRSGT